jgi:hypothetical protein
MSAGVQLEPTFDECPARENCRVPMADAIAGIDRPAQI